MSTRFLVKQKLSLKTDKSIKIISRISKKLTDNFSQTITVYSLFAIIQSTFYRLVKGQHYLKKIYVSNFKS